MDVDPPDFRRLRPVGLSATRAPGAGRPEPRRRAGRRVRSSPERTLIIFPPAPQRRFYNNLWSVLSMISHGL